MKKIVFLMLLGMTLTACSKKEAVKQGNKFKLIADFRIQPEDLDTIDLTEFEDFNFLYELVGAEQALKIQDITLKGHKFNSFKGIEKFQKLWALSIEDLEITDFNGLFFNNDWLDYSDPGYADMPAIAFKNTVIHSFNGLTDITNLREVSFINCSFEQSKEIVLPSQLHTLYFFIVRMYLIFLMWYTRI